MADDDDDKIAKCYSVVADDTYYDAMRAAEASAALEMGGAIHAVEIRGEVMWRPGATPDAYAEMVGDRVREKFGATIEMLQAALAQFTDTIYKRHAPMGRGKGPSLGTILKRNDEERMVYGWANISVTGGDIVVDKHGEMIVAEELEKAATGFMKSARIAKAMHEGASVGEVVHSMPLTAQIKKAFGVKTPHEGWMIGMHIKNDEIWKRVKSGELKAFSIGGTARKREV